MKNYFCGLRLSQLKFETTTPDKTSTVIEPLIIDTRNTWLFLKKIWELVCSLTVSFSSLWRHQFLFFLFYKLVDLYSIQRRWSFWNYKRRRIYNRTSDSAKMVNTMMGHQYSGIITAPRKKIFSAQRHQTKSRSWWDEQKVNKNRMSVSNQEVSTV